MAALARDRVLQIWDGLLAAASCIEQGYVLVPKRHLIGWRVPNPRS